MNASDARNKNAIEQVAGRASLTNTFTPDGRFLSVREGGRNLILLDEADCLSGTSVRETSTTTAEPPSLREFLRARYRTISALNASWGLAEGATPAPFPSFDEIPSSPGRAAWARAPAASRDLRDWRGTAEKHDYSDRGGLSAVTKLIRETLQPVVLTVNDARTLTRASTVFRTGVVRVRFHPLREETVRGVLHRVSMAENLGISDATVDLIARRVHGDLRAALNDLEAVAALPSSTAAQEVLGGRDIESNLFDATQTFLQSGRFWRNTEVMGTVDATPDDLLPWIEENLPRFAAHAPELADAFRVLARAQMHLSRGNRRRIWSLWSYASELMTGGVSLALHPRGSEGPSFRPQVEFPRFLAGMGGSKGSRAVRGTLLAKVSRTMHLSQRRARDQVLPMLEKLYREEHEQHRFQLGLARELGLDAEEIAYLLDREPDHASVQHLVHELSPAEEDGSAETPPVRKPAARGQRKLF
jgi:DNA polymerase III delta prime subunit